jgi:hypothetical protein
MSPAWHPPPSSCHTGTGNTSALPVPGIGQSAVPVFGFDPEHCLGPSHCSRPAHLLHLIRQEKNELYRISEKYFFPGFHSPNIPPGFFLLHA